MPTVYTIGFRKKKLAEFIALLREAGVDAVIDARLHNTSQLAGYSKRDDLAFLLRDCSRISYEHVVDLAPTPEILDAFRQDKDWNGYVERYQPLLVVRHAEDTGQDILSRYTAPCVLCSEPTADYCHRRLIVEYWAAHIPDLSIVHL